MEFSTLKLKKMQKDSNASKNQTDNAEKEVSNKEGHNPFRDAEGKQTKEETPEEEATAEQQRKDALTERD